ncbi:hypothetical protein, partial [Listeria monocytogenes]|uniref:hypothetical protein n=1 Tax=Listeria monocytogenes TaxID=1639 RepID=UPI003F6636CB
YIHWTNQTAPLIKNGSIAVKNLDPVIVAIDDKHPFIGKHPYRVRRRKLAGGYAGSSPSVQVASVGRKPVDLCVPISISNVDITFSADC